MSTILDQNDTDKGCHNRVMRSEHELESFGSTRLDFDNEIEANPDLAAAPSSGDSLLITTIKLG